MDGGAIIRQEDRPRNPACPPSLISRVFGPELEAEAAGRSFYLRQFLRSSSGGLSLRQHYLAPFSDKYLIPACWICLAAFRFERGSEP